MDNAIGTAVSRSGLDGCMRICANALHKLSRAQRKRRGLVVKETANLGERRFVAVVEFERLRFLVGGGAGSVTLLAQLPEMQLEPKLEEEGE